MAQPVRNVHRQCHDHASLSSLHAGNSCKQSMPSEAGVTLESLQHHLHMLSISIVSLRCELLCPQMVSLLYLADIAEEGDLRAAHEFPSSDLTTP